MLRKRMRHPFGPRVDCPVGYRIALVIPLLLWGALAVIPACAQQRDWPAISGSAEIMHSFKSPGPTDLVGRLAIDPSRRALAPWATVGVRWDGLSGDAYPIGNFGIRFRDRSVSAALGLSRDVAYRNLRPDTADNDPGTMSIPPAISVAPVNPTSVAPTSTGYTMQSIVDIVTSTEWNTGRLAVGIEAGWRLAGYSRGRPWLSATVATPLVERLALVASVDQRSDPSFSPRATHLAIGFAWRSVPWGHRRSVQPSPGSSDSSARTQPVPGTGFSVQQLPHGIRLRLVAPAAHEVEVRSDLTGWMTLSMRRIVDEAWQIDLATPPGVHRLAIRIDGGPWLPPPGLPLGSDGYGSLIGLLVIDP